MTLIWAVDLHVQSLCSIYLCGILTLAGSVRNPLSSLTPLLMHEILCIHFGPWTFLDRSIVTIPNRGGSRMNNDWFPKQTKKFGHALRGIFLDCTCNSRKSPFLCLRLISIKLWKPVWIRPSPTKKFVEVQEFTLVECISVHVLTLMRACSLRKV